MHTLRFAATAKKINGIYTQFNLSDTAKTCKNWADRSKNTHKQQFVSNLPIKNVSSNTGNITDDNIDVKHMLTSSWLRAFLLFIWFDSVPSRSQCRYLLFSVFLSISASLTLFRCVVSHGTASLCAIFLHEIYRSFVFFPHSCSVIVRFAIEILIQFNFFLLKMFTEHWDCLDGAGWMHSPRCTMIFTIRLSCHSSAQCCFAMRFSCL